MNEIALKLGSPTIARCDLSLAQKSTQSLSGRLGVDARMLFNSGIGTVIRNVLMHWHGIKQGPKPDLLVQGIAGMEWAAAHLPDFPSHRSDIPIYSLREQLSVPLRMRMNDTLWSPHFNVPLAAFSRVVVTIHDLLHLAHPEFFPGATKHLYARGMLGGAVSKARHIIAVSHFTASELVRHIGVQSSRISVVHNGVASRWFDRTLGPSPRQRPYFLFVGNIKPHKNLVRLIRAFSMIADSMKDHDLVIVGKKDGLITADLEAANAAAAQFSRVSFSGVLEDSDLKRYVSHAEALVYPSLYEGFGLPPLEAMAAGCPVVASDIPALRESCGTEAVYCDPLSPKSIAAALEAVSMLSSDERAFLIAAGKRRAQSFTWEKTAMQTLTVIESAAA